MLLLLPDLKTHIDLQVRSISSAISNMSIKFDYTVTKCEDCLTGPWCMEDSQMEKYYWYTGKQCFCTYLEMLLAVKLNLTLIWFYIDKASYISC